MSRRDSFFEEILDPLVAGVARDLKRLLYPRRYFDQMRLLDTPAEKLVYIFIWLKQPQTFTSIRRGLKVGKGTVARALKKLRGRRLVVQDRHFLYWTRRLEPQDQPEASQKGKI